MLKQIKSMGNLVKCDTEDIVVAKIFLKLEEMERSLRWLSNKCDFNYNSFYAIMRQRTMRLTPAYLEKINELLLTDYCIENGGQL